MNIPQRGDPCLLKKHRGCQHIIFKIICVASKARGVAGFHALTLNLPSRPSCRLAEFMQQLEDKTQVKKLYIAAALAVVTVVFILFGFGAGLLCNFVG